MATEGDPNRSCPMHAEAAVKALSKARELKESGQNDGKALQLAECALAVSEVVIMIHCSAFRLTVPGSILARYARHTFAEAGFCIRTRTGRVGRTMRSRHSRRCTTS